MSPGLSCDQSGNCLQSPDDPLANHLPPSWLNAAATTAHDVADPFSPEAVRQAQADQAAIAAVKAGTAVDRFIHVHEGDAHDMLAVLEHHIARGGGHTAPAPEDVIIATVPASYQPCLEAITAPELDRQLTPNYREFALAAVSGSHRCPPQPASPQRAVRIFFTVEPIGILNNYWDQIMGNTMLTVAALGLTGLAIGISCQTWFPSRPETSLN